ncbi:MAG: hypothetical protein C4541_06270 [Candidatus Auribacter fodinae]|jgi:predicted anti-sigma-YlaC factor YlaD|uniref:Putative zinc-finger domain-containing protein n=1 Tax=Candidatus Auribacter fodinae TaxID=2093366 RepID=A0A3A4R2Y4_9BACT|nr:MAG: hypothetical protein C4541_06270 [Candidatus Auribacter fodinae]
MNKNCEQFQILLSGYMDGELSAEQVKQLEQHSASCPECAELAADLKAVSAVTREYFSGVRQAVQGISIADEVYARLEEPAVIPMAQPRSRNVFMKPWFSAAVAAGLAIFFGFYFFFPSGKDYNVSQNTCVVDSVETRKGSVMVFKDSATDTTIIWLFSAATDMTNSGESVS